MTFQRFFTLLGIFTAAAVAVAVTIHLLMPIAYAIPLTTGAILMFIVISLAMFYVGKHTAAAENKFAFTNALMGLTMLKLVLCGGIILTYVFLGAPENKLFVIPFFTSYLLYTALEVFFLVKLAGKTSAKI